MECVKDTMQTHESKKDCNNSIKEDIVSALVLSLESFNDKNKEDVCVLSIVEAFFNKDDDDDWNMKEFALGVCLY